MLTTRRTMTLCVAVLAMTAAAAQARTWEEVQEIKQKQLETAARHAIEQQRTTAQAPQPLDATFSGTGGVAVEASGAWDIDGDGQSHAVTLKDIPEFYQHKGMKDRLQIRFDEPVDMLSGGTGLAFWVSTPDGFSRDVRMGVHFKIEGTDQDPVIIADTPVVQKFGDNPHMVYFDWGYVFDHTVGVFKVPPREFFSKVRGVDIVFVQKRLPREKVKLEPASGTFHIDGLALVDLYEGTYDNERFKGERINAKHPIVAQCRFQQVARICAEYGGPAGAASAVKALDMLARLQSWDGSWPEMQTRLQGEWTHGMILADAAWALKALREQEHPALGEQVTARHLAMQRDALYEQMIYRGAMSRSPAPIHTYADTYTTGEGALTGGCNRPMVFTSSQWAAAQVMTDADRKAEIMSEYDKNMDDLVAYQGATAGGWPIFGEGNRYQGKGLRWDVGYTTDHVFIMTAAARYTGDPRWCEMLKKFDTVVKAMILPNGWEIDGALSERGRGKVGHLKAPDLAYQEAVRCGAKYLAQWAANASERAWSQYPRGGTLWPSCSSFRGYALGAFLTWQCYDLQQTPEPKDVGVVFPRQWPVWAASWRSKETGEEVRRSKCIITPDGQTVNTFSWEVGQYPVALGIPVAFTVDGEAAVEIHPVAYAGDVARLEGPMKASMLLEMADDSRVMSLGEDGTFELELKEPTRVRITFFGGSGTEVTFHAVPRIEEGQAVTLRGRVLKAPEPTKHLYVKEEAADVDLDTPGVNLVSPSTGTRITAVKCYPNAQYGVERACDNNPGTAWVIGQMAAGTALKFQFTRAVPLARLVLSQGDWKETFHLAKAVTVKLSDGTTRTIELEKAPGKEVEVDLGGATAESLTLTVDEIYEREGNKGNVGGWMELKILTAGSK